ncbi:MAG: adenylosuccinate synthase [Bacteroidetes bacterium]|nr:adenylosuccinate synthase [Bacteroidota bacterium]
MKADVLLGLQWGDEGKGKIVDVIADKYDIVARFQGGPNAGHTLEFNGLKHVLHLIPSGIFHERIVNIIGNGVVIDPTVFKKEILALEKLGAQSRKNLFISKRAHLILPTHRLLDAASEAAKGKEKIGSTLKGIGPAYMDKTGRNGLRVGDIFSPDFKKKYDFLVEKHKQLLALYDFKYDLKEHEPAWFDGIETLKQFNCIESEKYLHDAFAEKKTVLAEGAQGSLLDIDFGTYPYVTSSNTVCAGACTGLGIAPNKIGNVIGIFKAYCTRVGSGPFPTELNDATGELIRKAGNEFGSTTGRPRRCGWLDLPALKYAIAISGVTELIMMKADVLAGLDTIKVCTHYLTPHSPLLEQGEGKIDFLPYDISIPLLPIYKDFNGWKTDCRNAGRNLPQPLLDYIHFIEKEVNTPITLISIGPDRTQIIQRGKESRKENANISR